MENSTERVVQYQGMDLRLTSSEYAALKRVAFEDPLRADSMARGLLDAQGLDDGAALDTYCPTCCAAPGTPCDNLGLALVGLDGFHRGRRLLLARKPA